MMIRLLLLVVLVCASPGAAESLPEVGSRPPWKLVRQIDDEKTGYVLHQMESVGSAALTFRLEAIVEAPPELVAMAATNLLAAPESRPPVTAKRVLRNDEDVLVVYSYIHINAPFVADRDVISRVERSYDPASGTHRLAWTAIDEGVPRKPGVIRLELSEGSWIFSPNGDGSTRAVYTSQADSAGYMPAWLVNSQMSDTMVEGIESLRNAVTRERSDPGIAEPSGD